MESNLSKIKPKLRTQGQLTGNFGLPKPKAGSPLTEIGETNSETVRITTRDAYIQRMLTIYNSAPTPSLKEFAYKELHRLGCVKQTRLASS
jgi:hypothetical protein